MTAGSSLQPPGWRKLLEATRREADENYGIPTDTQRPLNQAHCLALARHYRENHNWIIGPFVFTTPADNIAPEVNEGQFKTLDSSIQILDGQHRIQALHITHDQLKVAGSQTDSRRLENLLNANVALMFIENKGPADAAQLFVDLNRAKPVSSTELTYLDGRDPIVNSVKQALALVPWADVRTEKARATPNARSPEVWSINTLKTVLRVLEMGVKRSLPPARRRYIATPDGLKESSERLANFLQWLPTARPEYENLRDEAHLDVGDERTRHFAYDKEFINLLADAWSNSATSGPPHETLAQTVQGLNLNRADGANDVKAMHLDTDRGRMKSLARGDYQAASTRIRNSPSP